MIGFGCRKLLSLIVPLALGCGASDNVGSVVLDAVPPCAAGAEPSTLLTVDHPQSSKTGAYSASGFANALLVDDTGIYIGASFIVRAPLEGGRATALWTMQASATSFAITDSLLWAAATWGVSGLLGLPIEGTATSPSMAKPYEGIFSVAGAGKRVFFGGYPSEVDSYGSDLTSGPTISLAGSRGTLIAISGTDAFIVTSSPVGTKLERGSTSGGASTVLVASANDILSLAANTASVYWVEDAFGGAPRTVHRAAHDGSNAETIANVNASSIAVDEGAAYLTVDDGTIVKVAADTLTPTILAQGQVRPSAITQYGPRVYWINDREFSSATTPKANAVMTACK